MNDQNTCNDFCCGCLDSTDYICRICGNGYCMDCGGWATEKNGIVCCKCMDELLESYNAFKGKEYSSSDSYHLSKARLEVEIVIKGKKELGK